MTRTAANSGTARAIIDALGVEANEQELASLLTRANRAAAIANTDDYQNQCDSLRALIVRAPDPRIAAADAMAKALEATADELDGYVDCSDGCTCGDGWDHADSRTVANARTALAAWNALK